MLVMIIMYDLSYSQGVFMRFLQFSRNILLLRRTYLLTLEEFAILIGLRGRGSLGTLENAKNPPSFDTLLNIADVFGVSIDWLVGNSKIPYTHSSLKSAEDKFFAFALNIDDGNIFKMTLKDYLEPEYRMSKYSLDIRANILVLLRILMLPKLLNPSYKLKEPTLGDKIFSVFKPILYKETSQKTLDWIDAYSKLMARQTSVPIFDINKIDA